MTCGMLLLSPGCLHQAQHGVQRVARGVINQALTLRMREFEPQTQPRLAVFERSQHVFACDQSLGGLQRLGIVFVAARRRAQQLPRQQPGIALQGDAGRISRWMAQAR